MSAKPQSKRLPAEERQRQILRSAIHVFAQHTYHGATTKGIAEEAGVTEALIYRYFGSKRALFTEAIDYTAARIVAGLQRVLQQHAEDPEACTRGCFDYYTQLLERSEDSAKMLFLVLSELDQEDVRQAYLPHQLDILDTIATLIQRWREQGLIRPEIDTRSASWLYFGSYIVLALVKHSHHEARLDVEVLMGLARPYFT